MTVKLRSGIEPGDRSGLELARRLVAEAGVAAITLHPRPARARHKGRADYALVRELAESVDVPVIVSGGARTPERARCAYEESGAAAVMIARGSLGNPWIFERLRDGDDDDVEPSPAAVEAELGWVIDRAEEHWGPVRAARNLRKFYPWYLARLGRRGDRGGPLPAHREPRRGAATARPDRVRSGAIIARSPEPVLRSGASRFGRFHAEMGRRLGSAVKSGERRTSKWLVKR